MPYYPFKMRNADDEIVDTGSFETVYFREDNYLWADPDTVLFELACDYICEDQEVMKKVLGKIREAKLEGYDADMFLNEDDKDLWNEFQKAQKSLAGWYYRPCLPGCMPDGDPTGPFATEEEAIKEAQLID